MIENMRMLLMFVLVFSVIFTSCKKDDDVKKKEDVENNGNGGNNNGNNGGSNNGGTTGNGQAKNNTVLGHTDSDTEGSLTTAYAWTAYGSQVLSIPVNGRYDGRMISPLITLMLGTGKLPEADRSYDFQGVVFTGQNENVFISLQTGQGSANTWYTSPKLGGKLNASVHNDGSITFSFDKVTFEVSKPPYSETKVFSGKFTLPSDFTVESNSEVVIYDLAG